jgi:ribosomal protein L11 methyltransferase
MTDYTELNLTISPLEPWRDVLVDGLGELGFDSFQETEQGVLAYIPGTRFDQAAVLGFLHAFAGQVRVKHGHRTIGGRNWNSEWERSFQPVEVGRMVRIRAEFHARVEGFVHDIVITPRMAFGTGHHATTRMMVEAMLPLEMADRTVCDLGCGTAVLAILAERLGAAQVHAIDNDAQAVVNARENAGLNGCERVVVDNGDVHLLRPASCAVILANIERNTLLRDMLTMRDALVPGGVLLLSGFVVADAPLMVDAVREAGMVPAESLHQGEWALIGCRKP